jgi:ubiquinone/menaquinone biosynthesis C-methylase UbiE
MRLRPFNRLTIAVVALLATTQARIAQPQPADSQRLFARLGLKAGDTVGEIGAGKGALSLAAAHVVGATGKVYASELGEKRVQELERAVSAAALPQISVVAGSPTSTNFRDACCDAIFMQDVYHHFTDPSAMNAGILRSLKPGGRLVIVDFAPPPDSPEAEPANRAKDGSHGVRPATLTRELTQAGFEGIAIDAAGDRWFLLVATKPAAPAPRL